MKRIALLGSTGSIGTQAIELCRELPGMKICALSAHKNIGLLEKQMIELRPEAVAVTDEESCAELRRRTDGSIPVFGGKDAIRGLFDFDFDITLNAIVGSAGLEPTLWSIEQGRDVALANKESLVAGGELVMRLARENGVRILPVDSEHSAIFQCLQASGGKFADKLLLTASGGPFREYGAEELKTVTREQALRHPNWSMGAKITIDSATMMNKGLEFIEACHLFAMPPERVEILVHPQSIVHSMVEFRDGAVIAQLGTPDMKLPIAYALTYPERLPSNAPKLSLAGMSLSFSEPREDVFPCIALAKAAFKAGGLLPAAMNAANETAVARFLAGNIKFTDIPRIIEAAMNNHIRVHAEKYVSLENIRECDKAARAFAMES